jgi:hypothetical protein
MSISCDVYTFTCISFFIESSIFVKIINTFNAMVSVNYISGPYRYTKVKLDLIAC